jgi:hypothetical protein
MARPPGGSAARVDVGVAVRERLTPAHATPVDREAYGLADVAWVAGATRGLATLKRRAVLTPPQLAAAPVAWVACKKVAVLRTRAALTCLEKGTIAGCHARTTSPGRPADRRHRGRALHARRTVLTAGGGGRARLALRVVATTAVALAAPRARGGACVRRRTRQPGVAVCGGLAAHPHVDRGIRHVRGLQGGIAPDVDDPVGTRVLWLLERGYRPEAAEEQGARPERKRRHESESRPHAPQAVHSERIPRSRPRDVNVRSSHRVLARCTKAS